MGRKAVGQLGCTRENGVGLEMIVTPCICMRVARCLDDAMALPRIDYDCSTGQYGRLRPSGPTRNFNTVEKCSIIQASHALF